MRNKEMDFVLPMEQAERLIDSPTQLVKINGEDGTWSGMTVNKADIVMTVRDFDEERHENYNRDQLPEPIGKTFDFKKFKPESIKFNEHHNS